ncbi:hypothetical protein [Mycobacterium antarcticum]|uniref:hypothetical protein n=1 Tax=Mycolicibacterium sp. TUM20984 TaxID=3023368 RepID=UPI0023826E7B|nr:hypothetical protein [Mycolicibacterium sp. TUM20984]GLP83568.1 hypothetical protein TUM20984_49880 [Mycolicibacterium sp. TUM20984]
MPTDEQAKALAEEYLAELPDDAFAAVLKRVRPPNSNTPNQTRKDTAMSLEAMESEIEDLRAQAAELNDNYARTQSEISADPHLTDAGKAEALAPFHEQLTTSVAALRHREKAVISAKREALERNLYGTSGYATEISGFREAQSIAARLTDDNEAHALYTNALRSDDKVLARAVFQQAEAKGWGKVTREHVSRNPATAAALKDLETIRRLEQNTLAASVHYMTPGLSTARSVTAPAVSSGQLRDMFFNSRQQYR